MQRKWHRNKTRLKLPSALSGRTNGVKQPANRMAAVGAIAPHYDETFGKSSCILSQAGVNKT